MKEGPGARMLKASASINVISQATGHHNYTFYILGIKHGDKIALQSFSRHRWLDCSGSQCTHTTCPKVYFEGNDWNTCRDNIFHIYRARGPGDVLVGDLVGIYLSNERENWFSCRNSTCGKSACPGIATTDHGFAIEEHWYRCYGEVFKIYARGRNMSEPIVPNDDVLLNYIQEYNWVQSATPVRKALCPGSVRPPPAERYDVCYVEVHQIWKNSTSTN